MPETTDDSRTLRLMTLNTWGFKWPLARHRAIRFDRIGAHIDASDYDIVGLQELWGGAKQALGRRKLAWAPNARPVDEQRRHRRVGMVDSGLGVKLRPGLVPDDAAIIATAHAFRDHRGWDRVKRKGLLKIDVPLADLGTLSIIVTHLQAQERHARIRRMQLDELGELVDGVDNPIVLLGDFNLHDSSAEDAAGHAQLTRWGFLDASEAVDRPFATYLKDNPYVPAHEGDERFDRIYVRDGSRLRVTPREHDVISDHAAPLSDHETVTATVVVSRIS